MLHGHLHLTAKESSLKVFAIDIGMGTQDVLVYETRKNHENNIKMVFPSPTRILARRVMQADRNLFVRGVTMGGGPFAFALKSHVDRGFRVAMQTEAASTVRDDLNQVRELGIEVVEEPPFDNYTVIETKDVNLEFYREILESLGEDFNFDYIGVAVQDHGRAPPGESDRVFRFKNFRRLMERGKSYLELGYKEPPEYYTRMQGVMNTLKDYNVFISDSKLAAIVGALHGIKERPVIAIDIGNGHTLIALVGEDDRVIGMLEHHTGLLNKNKLEELIIRFANGNVTNEEIYNDSGHGCHIIESVGIEQIRRILVTGPNRKMLQNSSLEVEFATPIGDVMMTGTIGLVDMIEYLSR